MSKEISAVIKKNNKYQIFRDNNFINDALENNKLIFKDKNKESIGFLPDLNKLIYEKLIEIFDIKDKDIFRSKFNEAVSGDGHELLNMLTIWSSSLCALLCFYNVNNNPLHITINYEGKNIECCFREVYFEVKNKVLKNPSNVDVVLIDRENKVILFLESKFAEYLEYDKVDIPDSYKNYLKDISREELFNFIKDDSVKRYNYGLKQLLTHYIGLYNFTNDKLYKYEDSDNRKEVLDFYSKNCDDCKVFLQEIVFDNDKDKKEEYFKNLNKVIEYLNWNGKVKVLSPTTYQEVFSKYEGFNKKIKEFYKF